MKGKLLKAVGRKTIHACADPAAGTSTRKMPQRLPNSNYRSREYLTEAEVMQLIEAAGRVGRNRQRDSAMIMLGYRHGLRVSELIQLRWDQIDFGQRLMHVTRLKHGNPSVQPLGRSEVDVLTELRRRAGSQRYVFCSELGTPLSADAFRKIIGRAGVEAGITFAVHPHMLRHACGYKLAQAGQDTRAIQDYLGHRNIQHTVRYTQLSSERFKDFWQD